MEKVSWRTCVHQEAFADHAPAVRSAHNWIYMGLKRTQGKERVCIKCSVELICVWLWCDLWNVAKYRSIMLEVKAAELKNQLLC